MRDLMKFKKAERRKKKTKSEKKRAQKFYLFEARTVFFMS